MQAMPEIKTPRIHPPIALFKDAPKNNPTTAHKIIIITDTTVLNFFIQSHSFVKLEFDVIISVLQSIPSHPYLLFPQIRKNGTGVWQYHFRVHMTANSTLLYHKAMSL